MAHGNPVLRVERAAVHTVQWASSSIATNEQAQATEELRIVRTVIFFNTGFNSGAVNKAQCEERTVSTTGVL